MHTQPNGKSEALDSDDALLRSSRGAANPLDEATTDHKVVAPINTGFEVDRSAFAIDEGLLFVARGQKAGARYALDTELITLGRHPQSDIFLDDISVSRRHAEVRRIGSRYLVRDVGSLNGTYVQGQRVDEHELLDGEVLQVGRYKMIFAHGTRLN